MGDNKGRNYGRSNNRCSQGGINQKHCGYSGRSRAQSNHRKSKRGISSPTTISKLVESPLNPSLLPTNIVSLDGSNTSTSKDKEGFNDLKSGLSIAGIVIGSLIILTVIVYCLIQFIKKGRKSSKDEDEEEELPNPRELTLNFVKHNHPIPELCTTPDTQPILDYYSSKAGLTNSPPIINSNKLHGSDNNDDDHKSIPVEINENAKEPSENINNERIPQYYNGMEIPPLGARIIPLERQVQIAKELTSANLSPRRKSNRSISSILSINSRRKSSTSINNNNNNNNSSTTSTLTLIRETPRNEGNENAAN